MTDQQRAEAIVHAMYSEDEMSKWMGMKIIKTEPGRSVVEMMVREEMVNGFKIAHGGITYSLADSALAFACNSRGLHSVSIETKISHMEAVYIHDILRAEANEVKKKNSVAWYTVDVFNQHDVLVAKFEGTVYRTKKEWDV